jgi:vanillate O-demethylase ferredoxin subunit
MNRWFAVTASAAVPRGHIAHAQLLGQELALWRSASGQLNAWENRCPHRGVRLTLGSCSGEQLRCQYHAWRFASGSGQCTLIPSHPGQVPASTIHPAVFAVFEDGAFAWVNPTRESDARPPALSPPGTPLRSIFTLAPVATVRQILREGYAGQAVSLLDEFTLDVSNPDAATLRFMLQPVTRAETVIHAHLQGGLAAAERLAVLRHHNWLLGAVRDRAEAAA